MKVKDILKLYHSECENVGIYDSEIEQPMQSGTSEEIMSGDYADMEVKQIEISYTSRSLWLTV